MNWRDTLSAWWHWTPPPTADDVHPYAEVLARLDRIDQCLLRLSPPLGSTVGADAHALDCGHLSASFVSLRDGTAQCHDCHREVLRLEREGVG